MCGRDGSHGASEWRAGLLLHLLVCFGFEFLFFVLVGFLLVFACLFVWFGWFSEV